MKTFKILFAAIVFVGFTSNAFSQQLEETQSVTASAVVVSDITIDDVTNVNFGVVALGETATLDEKDNTATNAGLTASGFELGRIAVTSAEHVAFSFTYDASVVLENENQTQMTFVPSVSHTTNENAEYGSDTDLDDITSSGSDYFFIGGTIDVGATQESGNYSGDFNVTVEYL